MSDKKTLKQEYTERLRKYERELSLKLRNVNKTEMNNTKEKK
jgi:hypothetical protein